MKVHHFIQQAGHTLIEALVVLFLSSVILAAAVSGFSHLSRTMNDAKLRDVAQLQAQSVVDMMTPDLRMLGNGVPFHQANFLIAQATLTDNTVTQPILVSGTTANQIQFRLNESGETYILTADFNPATQTTVTLTSVSKLIVGDPIYITNSTVGEDDGLWGIIQSINTGAKTVTLQAGVQYSPGATFLTGSLLEAVPTITYASTADYGGITRDDGFGAQTLATTGQFTLSYLNSAGTEITLPLVASSADPFPDSAIQNVHAIKMVVEVRTSRPLGDGDYYVATAEQTVGIRNLNYKY